MATTSLFSQLFNCILHFAEAESSRLTTVLQENAVLRSELEVMRLRCKNLVEENRKLRQASVTIVSSRTVSIEHSSAPQIQHASLALIVCGNPKVRTSCIQDSLSVFYG